jgi:hypothetical protein
MADVRDPWERQPKESARAYEAFVAYRDMGPGRAVRAVARELGKSVTLIGRWSSAHHWVERAEAWDAEQDRVRLEEAQRQARLRAEKWETRRTAHAEREYLLSDKMMK